VGFFGLVNVAVLAFGGYLLVKPFRSFG